MRTQIDVQQVKQSQCNDKAELNNTVLIDMK